MRSDDLQEVEGSQAVARHTVPEAIVAAGPYQPHIAALDLVVRQGHAIVHGAEVVFLRVGEVCLIAAGCLRLIQGCRMLLA